MRIRRNFSRNTLQMDADRNSPTVNFKSASEGIANMFIVQSDSTLDAKSSIQNSLQDELTYILHRQLSKIVPICTDFRFPCIFLHYSEYSFRVQTEASHLAGFSFCGLDPKFRNGAILPLSNPFIPRQRFAGNEEKTARISSSLRH